MGDIRSRGIGDVGVGIRGAKFRGALVTTDRVISIVVSVPVRAVSRGVGGGGGGWRSAGWVVALTVQTLTRAFFTVVAQAFWRRIRSLASVS